jgi:2-polyprenyl-6-methoxyphenol hydroxylase-like FAD-dependent oxidoreductase
MLFAGRGEVPVNDTYDVLVVGGRCAGSATAISLGRKGYRVLLVERQRMPSPIISTHVLWPDGVAALNDLGVLDEVLATGSPLVDHFRLCHGEDIVLTDLAPYRGFSSFICVRRHLLDGILFEAARRTPGVEVLDNCRLDSLLWTNDRVTGGRLVQAGVVRDVRAELVVGADGRDSTVAAGVNAAERDIVEPGRYWYYAYFADANEPEPMAMTDSGAQTDTVVSIRTDSGLQMVVYAAWNEDFQEMRANFRKNYLERIHRHPVIDRMLASARLASPVYGFPGVRGYYRELYGPGWVLVGDAGHQKDPIVARGINDALMSGIDLAERVADGITDEALAGYAEGVVRQTATTTRTARMLARPDRHMSADQAGVLGAEVSTPEGLRRVLGLEYGLVSFEDLFGTDREGVIEHSAER